MAMNQSVLLEYASYLLACWGVGWTVGILFRSVQSIVEKLG